MSYLKRLDIEKLGKILCHLAGDYATKAKGELPVDRIMYGYLAARYAKVTRQIPTRYGKQRIDFLIGGTATGTFIELVVRGKGSEWRLTVNKPELNKLCRENGTQRSLLILDVSGKAALTKTRLKDEFKNWKSSPGKYPRKGVCVTYCTKAHAFSFGVKALRSKKATVSP